MIFEFEMHGLSVTIIDGLAQKHNYKPESGYIPDEETAIKIAVAVWTPIYSKEQIEKEKPYKSTLKDGIWYVSGSLPEG